MRKPLEKAWLVTKILFLRLRFIFLFVVIGLIVGHWSWIMNVADRFLRPPAAEEAEQKAGEYEWYCGMHPWIVRNDPRALCPVCGMKLSQRKRGIQEKLSAGVLARLRLSESRVLQAGVGTEEVTYRTLVREVRTVGSITYDERRLRDLSARIAGRADKLFVDFTGVRVRAGDPLYEIYSPELVTTEEEYLLALQNLATLESEAGAGKAGGEAARDRARRLVAAARERLRLWGIGDEEVQKLERTRKVESHLVITSPFSGVVVEKKIHAGHYVEVGEDPYTLADDSVVWLQAEVFEADLGLVHEGQVLEVTAEAYPGARFAGTVAFIAPALTVTPVFGSAIVEGGVIVKSGIAIVLPE